MGAWLFFLYLILYSLFFILCMARQFWIFTGTGSGGSSDTLHAGANSLITE